MEKINNPIPGKPYSRSLTRAEYDMLMNQYGPFLHGNPLLNTTTSIKTEKKQGNDEIVNTVNTVNK
jgi:hypothetical protein